nr:hypothetical protein [Tanacetum cinerariifolium]
EESFVDDSKRKRSDVGCSSEARKRIRCDGEETGLPPTLANSLGTLHTLELKSNSYYEHTNYDSFTCWSVVLEEALDESGSSGTLDLITTPSVTTPSKSGEHKKPRRS